VVIANHAPQAVKALRVNKRSKLVLAQKG
jgi:hypothetical protein